MKNLLYFISNKFNSSFLLDSFHNNKKNWGKLSRIEFQFSENLLKLKNRINEY
jgi:hypothetical protein